MINHREQHHKGNIADKLQDLQAVRLQSSIKNSFHYLLVATQSDRISVGITNDSNEITMPMVSNMKCLNMVWYIFKTFQSRSYIHRSIRHVEFSL